MPDLTASYEVVNDNSDDDDDDDDDDNDYDGNDEDSILEAAEIKMEIESK